MMAAAAQSSMLHIRQLTTPNIMQSYATFDSAADAGGRGRCRAFTPSSAL